MSKIPEQCPSCSAGLLVTQLGCPQCGSVVQGQYQPNIFSRLNPNDLHFVMMFLKAKGNVKEMERELGISYWTIRRRLDELVEELGLDDYRPQADLSAERIVILERLRTGEIAIDEAADLLESLKRADR